MSRPSLLIGAFQKDSKRYPEYVSSRYPSTEYDSTLPESEAFPLPGGRDRLTHQIDWSASNLYQNVTVVFGDHEEYDVLNGMSWFISVLKQCVC